MFKLKEDGFLDTLVSRVQNTFDRIRNYARDQFSRIANYRKGLGFIPNSYSWSVIDDIYVFAHPRLKLLVSKLEPGIDPDGFGWSPRYFPEVGKILGWSKKQVKEKTTDMDDKTLWFTTEAYYEVLTFIVDNLLAYDNAPVELFEGTGKVEMVRSDEESFEMVKLEVTSCDRALDELSARQQQARDLFKVLLETFWW